MNEKRIQPSYIVTLMTLLALTACGKNLSIGVADGKAEKELKPSTIDVSKFRTYGSSVAPSATPNSGLERKDTAEQKPETSSEVNVETTVNDVKPVIVNDPSVDHTAIENSKKTALQPYTPFDLLDKSASRLFTNSPYDTRVIGQPSILDAETGLGFNKNSNLVFRAIVEVPAKDEIKEIKEFNISLTGLRLFVAKSNGAKSISLKGQMICIAETGECSGERPLDSEGKSTLIPETDKKINLKSDLFAKLELNLMKDYGNDGAVYHSAEPLTLEMRKLFGLEKLSTPELVDWILKNSTEFAAPDYRKIRFVAGNNLHVDAGELILNISSVKALEDKLGDVKAVVEDARTPVSANPELIGLAQAAPSTSNSDAPAEGPAAPQAPASSESGSTAAVQTSSATVIQPGSEGTNSETGSVTEIAETNSPPRPQEKAIELQPAGLVSLGAGPVAELNIPAQPLVQIERNAESGEKTIKLILDDYHLNFDHDKVTIKTSGLAKLKKTSKLLASSKAVVSALRITGHTDKTGARDYNLDLSKRRAKAVAKNLLNVGVKPQIQGKGEPKVSSCKNSADCRWDRRVDISIIWKDASESDLQSVRAELANIWKVGK